MCMCGKPVVNGEPGYSWDGKSVGVRPVNPPDIEKDDVIWLDLPGRCGGLDSHCHHFRVVKRHSSYYLLVRHGGGDERISLGSRPGVEALAALDSTGQYWLLQMLFSVQRDSQVKGHENCERKWRHAAAEKRIKTRKQRGGGGVKVWIESPKQAASV